MSKFTDFLNLFMWDSVEDSEEEFNIDKALNDNWKKIDTKVKTHVNSVNEEVNSFKTEVNQKIDNIQALPVGGTKGQVLTKQSETDGDANWEDIEANEVFVGNEEEAPSSAKIIVEDEDFEEGSTLSKAEVYVGAEEPTNGEKVWFRKGKNLLDNKKITDIGKKFETKIDGDNVYSSSSSDSRAWKYENSNWLIDLPAGTYTVSLLYSKQSTNNNSGIGIYSKSKEILFKTTANLSRCNYTFTLEEETLIGIMMKIYDGIFKIQIEPGSSATPYETYIEPQIYVRNSNGVYEEFTKKEISNYSYSYKGLEINATKNNNIVTLTINGSITEKFLKNTFYDIEIDSNITPNAEVNDSIYTSANIGGMIRIATNNKIRIYPWADFNSGLGIRYTLTYLI